MNKTTVTLVTLLGLTSLQAARAPEAEAADSANECVHLRESARDDGLALAIDNDCERPLSCSVSWVVQCESATGRVTRESKDGARLVVSAAASEATFASAKSCGDAWRIAQVSWDCAPSK